MKISRIFQFGVIPFSDASINDGSRLDTILQDLVVDMIISTTIPQTADWMNECIKQVILILETVIMTDKALSAKFKSRGLTLKQILDDMRAGVQKHYHSGEKFGVVVFLSGTNSSYVLKEKFFVFFKDFLNRILRPPPEALEPEKEPEKIVSSQLSTLLTESVAGPVAVDPTLFLFICNNDGSVPTYWKIIELMRGKCPDDCLFKLVFEIDRSKLKSTDLCRCTARTVPKCQPCHYGRSSRTESQIDSLVRDMQQSAQYFFDKRVKNVKTFLSNCNNFPIFLSSSVFLVNLQGSIFGRKPEALSLDFKSILKNYTIKFRRNSLSIMGRTIGLWNCDDMFPYVRMLPSFKGICPDFANNPIRIELLTLSISMKVLFRVASLCHLNNNLDIQTTLMRQIAQYSLSRSFRRQIMQ
jgi:hypothetical protein